jgi:hypothetical protein
MLHDPSSTLKSRLHRQTTPAQSATAGPRQRWVQRRTSPSPSTRWQRGDNRACTVPGRNARRRWTASRVAAIRRSRPESRRRRSWRRVGWRTNCRVRPAASSCRADSGFDSASPLRDEGTLRMRATGVAYATDAGGDTGSSSRAKASSSAALRDNGLDETPSPFTAPPAPTRQVRPSALPHISMGCVIPWPCFRTERWVDHQAAAPSSPPRAPRMPCSAVPSPTPSAFASLSAPVHSALSASRVSQGDAASPAAEESSSGQPPFEFANDAVVLYTDGSCRPKVC